MLDAAIKNAYPTDYVALSNGQWLVADSGTAQTVSEKVGITKIINGVANSGPSGAGLVLSVSGYFGAAAPNIWEWIKSKWGSV